MRFDIDAIDLINVFFGFLFICLFTGIIWIVGALFENSLIMDFGYYSFVVALMFGLLFMVLIGVMLIYDGIKWCWK